MNKEILCIYTLDSILCKKKQPIRYLSDIPLGLSYIMSAIKHAGYNFELFVFSQKNSIKKDINALFERHNFDIVLFTSVSSQYFFVKKIAQYIKQIKPNINNLIGGVHATLNFKDVLNDNCFDAVCVGDGEYATVEWIKYIRNNKKLKNINNLYIRTENNTILNTKKIYFIEDLDNIPYPSRDIWYKWISFPNSINSAHMVLLTRGCYNNCSYCSNHALAKISNTKYVRYRSIDKIIDEINSLHAKRIEFCSESLTLNLKFLDKLLDALIENNRNRLQKIEYIGDINVYKSALYEGFFKKLSKANIKSISVGLESGSYNIRKNILHRPAYTNQDFLNFCKLAQKHNIAVYVYVLIGIPYETQEDYLETIIILRKANPNFIRFYIYTPYPGTDLCKKLVENKLIKNLNFLNFSNERIKALVSYGNMSKIKIQFNYFSFLFRVYFGKKSLIEILKLTCGIIIYTYNKYIPCIFYNFLEKKLEKSITKAKECNSYK